MVGGGMGEVDGGMTMDAEDPLIGTADEAARTEETRSCTGDDIAESGRRMASVAVSVSVSASLPSREAYSDETVGGNAKGTM